MKKNTKGFVSKDHILTMAVISIILALGAKYLYGEYKVQQIKEKYDIFVQKIILEDSK